MTEKRAATLAWHERDRANAAEKRVASEIARRESGERRGLELLALLGAASRERDWERAALATAKRDLADSKAQLGYEIDQGAGQDMEITKLKADLATERDHSLSMETLVGSLCTELATVTRERDWEREHGDSRTAYYQGRCLELLKQRDALAAAGRRMVSQRDALKKAVVRVAGNSRSIVRPTLPEALAVLLEVVKAARKVREDAE